MSDQLKPLLIGAAVGGALALGLSLLGVETPFAIGWGIVVIAAFGVARPVLAETIPAWPPQRVPLRSRGSEVSRLGWSFNSRTGLAGRRLVHRVRALVTARLARHGLDFDDPSQHHEIDALLGVGVREALLKEELGIGELERALDAAERLSAVRPDADGRTPDTPQEER